MIILVSGSTKSVAKHPECGVLIVPAAKNKVPPNRIWAADNGGYHGVNFPLYEQMLDRLHHETKWKNCLFVTAPDVVAKSRETLDLFQEWQPKIRRYGAPVALVAQDGLHAKQVPWRHLDALFIGGSTHWKLSRQAATLVAYARANGKWAHVGRVNSGRRMDIIRVMGAQSSDGTCYSRYGDVFIPKGLHWASRPLPAVVQFSMLH